MIAKLSFRDVNKRLFHFIFSSELCLRFIKMFSGIKVTFKQWMRSAVKNNFVTILML